MCLSMNSGIAVPAELLAHSVYKRWQAGELQSKAEFRLPARLQDNHVSEREFGRDKLFVHIRFLRLLTRDDNSFKRYVW
jgi:hypothetical protein